MPKIHIFTDEQREELLKAEKKNRDKGIDKRIKAVRMRSQGIKAALVASETGFSQKYVSELVSKYVKNGIFAIAKNHYGGNHRALTYTEESEILEKFRKQAEKGEVVTIRDIKKAFDEKRGKDTGRGYIYMLLKRHNLRKVMPRSKHPKKASAEVIESTKNKIKNSRKAK